MGTTAMDAVVVGAGPAGLATSRALARRGIEHVVLERGPRVGHSWRQFYDSLVLHTGKHLSALPGLRFPASTPLFPTRADVVAYLDRYAAHFRLPVRTSAAVTTVERIAGLWRVRTRDGMEIAARAVVVATGTAASPWTPDIPGRREFAGRMLHSAEYRRSTDVAGPRVLVVGGGNSAADIATELAAAGRAVTLSVRSPLRFSPLTVLGAPAQYVAFPLGWLPLRLQRAIVARGDRRQMETRDRNAAVGCLRIPVIGSRQRHAIEQGEIGLASALTALTRDGARFADGSTRAFDDVLLATGFRPALGCLATVRVRRDACGAACRRRRVASADAPTLFFVGQNADIRGTLFSLRCDARLTARMIARSVL
jgi:cation diffusion facilitator CzcD-associated flavoprotein CzcO